MKITSTAQIVGALLRRHGGRIELTDEELERPYEQFSTMDKEGGALVVHRSVATAEELEVLNK